MSQLELLPSVVLPATLMPLHGAVISDDEIYRYILTRSWDTRLPPMVFCMLNPSTADGSSDDPTIRKCVGFAMRNECGGVVVVNLFAFRSTDPTNLTKQHRAGVDIVGPDNDIWIKHAFGIGRRQVVCGWGVGKDGHQRSIVEQRARRIAVIASEVGASLHAIGINAGSNTPRHPLMTPYATPMTDWSPT